MSRVDQIFIAASRGIPMHAVPSVTALTDEGLQGDRYALAKNRRSPDYQVTLIELEHIEAFRKDTGLVLDAHMLRRNIVTFGSRLNDYVSKHFVVGGVTLEGLELCEPCSLVAKRTHREALRYFVGKGGLRARIVAGGVISLGDAIGVPT